MTSNSCSVCITDRDELLAFERPEARSPTHSLRLVDLFSGAGGLTVGVMQAAAMLNIGVDIPLAVELDPHVADLYHRNFPEASLTVGDIGNVFPGELGERADRPSGVNRVDLLVAGPPCQGNSDLNNHTRRNAPTNLLYLKVARAAEILRPRVVIIENVPGVRHDTASVVGRTLIALAQLGYEAAGAVVKFDQLGVPQRRRRYVLIATRVPALDPGKLLASLACHHERDVRWAIGDLTTVDSGLLVDVPSPAASITRVRMQYLLDNGLYDLPDELRPACHRDNAHTYRSVYGRLRWDAPSQTITTGFTSMGQGRFMHPSQARTLTPHEAARIQGFPEWYSWGEGRRTVLAKAIGNAVPPTLTRRLVPLIWPLLRA